MWIIVCVCVFLRSVYWGGLETVIAQWKQAHSAPGSWFPNTILQSEKSEHLGEVADTSGCGTENIGWTWSMLYQKSKKKKKKLYIHIYIHTVLSYNPKSKTSKTENKFSKLKNNTLLINTLRISPRSRWKALFNVIWRIKDLKSETFLLKCGSDPNSVLKQAVLPKLWFPSLLYAFPEFLWLPHGMIQKVLWNYKMV